MDGKEGAITDTRDSIIKRMEFPQEHASPQRPPTAHQQTETAAHALRVRDALEVAPLKYEAGQEQYDSGVRYAIANGGQHIPGRNRNAVNRFSFDVE